MPSFTLSKTVRAPVPATFAAFTDVDRAAETVPDIVRIEKLTPGPVGRGTTFKETRVMFGREATETMTFSEFEPDVRFVMSAASCGAEFATEFRFTPDADGTRVDVTVTTRAVSLYAKLFTPLAWLMTGMMKKCMARDFDALAAAAEGAKRAA